MRVFGGGINQNQRRYHFGAVRRSHWYDFVLHVRWAHDNTGFHEVWIDRRQVLPKTYGPTIYFPAPSKWYRGVYVKQGFYRRASKLTTVIYHDAMRRGDSLEAVAPWVNGR
jgi:hypothetical protein